MWNFTGIGYQLKRSSLLKKDSTDRQMDNGRKVITIANLVSVWLLSLLKSKNKIWYLTLICYVNYVILLIMFIYYKLYTTSSLPFVNSFVSFNNISIFNIVRYVKGSYVNLPLNNKKEKIIPNIVGRCRVFLFLVYHFLLFPNNLSAANLDISCTQPWISYKKYDII